MASVNVLLTGGGTGGHITPILAVAHELKQIDPEIQITYVGERHGKFSQLTEGHSAIDYTHSVFAGKLRRYHGESWFARVLDIKTNLLNLRDFFYFVIGLVQSVFLIRRVRPDVVFLKGGYVGAPIGLAAAALKVPIITHDSDALPGLSNRLVSRWVAVHATALPAEYYPYPKNKVEAVGVLIEHNYKFVTNDMQYEYKKQLNLNPEAPLLLITGGSSGAQSINKVVVNIIDQLLKQHSSLQVIHQVGQGKSGVYGDYTHERLMVLEFMKPMHVYTGAADLIVTRAGGNTLAEFGVQGKACIVIPSPYLSGGHQLKNAELLKQREAVEVLNEADLYDVNNGLLVKTETLLQDKSKRLKLGLQLQSLTITGAAEKLAKLLLSQAKKHETKA